MKKLLTTAVLIFSMIMNLQALDVKQGDYVSSEEIKELISEGKRVEAINEIKKSMRGLSANNVKSHIYSLAVLSLELLRLKEAEKYFAALQHYKDLSPQEKVSALGAMAEVKLLSGSFEKAYDMYRELYSMTGNDRFKNRYRSIRRERLNSLEIPKGFEIAPKKNHIDAYTAKAYFCLKHSLAEAAFEYFRIAMLEAKPGREQQAVWLNFFGALLKVKDFRRFDDDEVIETGLAMVAKAEKEGIFRGSVYEAYFLFNKAEFLAYSGAEEKAGQTLEVALRMKPELIEYAKQEPVLEPILKTIGY